MTSTTRRAALAALAAAPALALPAAGPAAAMAAAIPALSPTGQRMLDLWKRYRRVLAIGYWIKPMVRRLKFPLGRVPGRHTSIQTDAPQTCQAIAGSSAGLRLPISISSRLTWSD